MSNDPEDYEPGTIVRFVQTGQTNFGEVQEVTEDNQGNPSVRVEWDDDAETTTQIDKEEMDIPRDQGWARRKYEE